MIKNVEAACQDIPSLLNSNNYVDKTDFAEKLMRGEGHGVFVRPRRFGKSLFLDLIAEICKNNKKQFKRSKIEKSTEYEWIRFPVIQLNLSDMKPANEFMSYENSSREIFAKIARSYNLTLRGDDVIRSFG